LIAKQEFVLLNRTIPCLNSFGGALHSHHEFQPENEEPVPKTPGLTKDVLMIRLFLIHSALGHGVAYAAYIKRRLSVRGKLFAEMDGRIHFYRKTGTRSIPEFSTQDIPNGTGEDPG
jgi:hypothetical protein